MPHAVTLSTLVCSVALILIYPIVNCFVTFLLFAFHTEFLGVCVNTFLGRMRCGRVTTWTVQQWEMAASFQFTSLVFPCKVFSGSGSSTEIRQTHVTKHVSSNSSAVFQEVVRAAEPF